MEKTPVRQRKTRQDMAVILRGIPPTLNWGWFSREDPRMHLQTVDKAHIHLHYKVWLENRGRRVIEPEPGIPAKILKTLQAEIVKQRERIEAEWAAFMIKNDWLQVRLSGRAVTLYAYSRTPNHFERTVDLYELIRNESIARKIRPEQVTLNEEFAFLELYPEREEGGRVHEPLGKILWVD